MARICHALVVGLALPLSVGQRCFRSQKVKPPRWMPLGAHFHQMNEAVVVDDSDLFAGRTNQPDYETLQSIIDSIANWVTKYRHARRTCSDLVNCDFTEVSNIARDLRLSPSELAILARNGPNSAYLLRDLLNVIGLDQHAVENDEPLVMRDLERLCTTCREKRQCRFDLANGAIADNFRDYCPNTFTLDALLQEKERRA